jgi:hypothetical protein
MTITIISARYIDTAGVLIDATIERDGQTFDFTLSPTDDAPLSVELSALLAAGGVVVQPYVAPLPLAPPVPQSVSRQQMMSALMLAGLITEAEWLACYQSGTLPALVQAAIDTLPDAASKLVAKVKWVEFAEAHRTDAMVALLAAQAGLTEAQIDDLFRNAAAL